MCNLLFVLINKKVVKICENYSQFYVLYSMEHSSLNFLMKNSFVELLNEDKLDLIQFFLMSVTFCAWIK